MIARPKTSPILVKSGSPFGWFYCDKQVVLGNKKFCREKISSLCQKHSALHLLQQILTMSSGSGSRLFPAFLLYITSITIIMHNSLEGKKDKHIALFNILFISTLNENFFSVFPLCLFNFGGCFQSCSILRVFAKYIMKIIRVCALWWSGELSPLKRANCFHWDEILILRLIFVGFLKPFYSTEVQSLSTL